MSLLSEIQGLARTAEEKAFALDVAKLVLGYEASEAMRSVGVAYCNQPYPVKYTKILWRMMSCERLRELSE